MPSREACQVYADALSASAKLIILSSNIRESLKKKRDIKLSLKYGLKGLGKGIVKLGDIISTELLSAIESVSAGVATSYIGSAISSTGSLFSSILAQILKILLFIPAALFSLVYIPLNQARLYNENERRYLYAAKENFKNINNTISRWLSQTIDDNKYLMQMVDAMPYISKALGYLSEIINSLGDSENYESQYPAGFDEFKFNLLQENLHEAIKITKPYSSLGSSIDLTSIIESDRDNRYRELAKPIEDQYKKDKQFITKKYQSDVSKNKKDDIENEVLRQKYALDLKGLDVRRKSKLDLAKANAMAQATADGSNYRKALNESGDAFIYDTQNLITNLNELNSNITSAYSNYKKSKLMCNNIYNSKKMIRYLINEMLSFIRTSKKSGKNSILITPFKLAESSMGVVSDKFSNAIDNRDKKSSIEMSQTVFLGHSLLNYSDTVLDTVVTEELKKLSNTKNILMDQKGEYDKFINDIANIPDWDGSLNVWAVKISFVPSPYIRSIADATELATKVPAFALSKNEKGKKSIRDSFLNVIKSIDKLMNHNSYVSKVLNSYEPYTNSDLTNLMQLLSNAGLLENFAMYMSIGSIITGLTADAVLRGFNDVLPSWDSCQQYEDMFDDTDMVLAVSKEEYSRPPVGVDPRIMDTVEKNALKTNALRKRIKSLRFYDDNGDIV